MDELERLARQEAVRQRRMAENEASYAEADTAFALANTALVGALSCLKASVEAGMGEITRMWPIRDNPDEVDEIHAVGPWVPYITQAGPLTMRLAGDYRDIKLPNPYLHRSVSLQVKTNSRGIIPTYEQYGSIWHSSGNFRNQGVLVGERGKDRQINPLSAKALKFYEVLQDIAIESVCEEDD